MTQTHATLCTIVGLTAAAIFVWNANRRAAMAAVAKDLKIPERLWTYDAADIADFAKAAVSRQVERRGLLEFYVSAILRQSDLAYAVALSAVTALIWFEIAYSPSVWTWLTWLAWPAAAMAIIYGVADVTEDLKLAAILAHPAIIDPAEAVAVNMLTRVKMMTLSLSLVGLVIFALTQILQWGFVRRPVPQQASDPRSE
jgi:hypothetical protein